MRTILHSDLNNFYASVELLKYPEFKDMPVVVCGSKEDRHGIVLAKNQIAKEMGVKTGEVLWEAERKCKHNLKCFPVDFESYLKVSKQVREIYSRYTDKIESFGIDECWLDVTASTKLFGSGEKIANEIRSAVKNEIGVTVSIGVSFNKVFAKLGSDMKKPDAVTLITPQNFKEKVWRLGVEELLYVGRATKKKLNLLGIHTIGDLANTDKGVLTKLLGVWGDTLHRYACGLDQEPVISYDESSAVKSIGNSFTNYKDATNVEEVRLLILLLAESVASRLRESGLGKAKTVKLTVVDNGLEHYGRQKKLARPSTSAIEIAKCGYELFDSFYSWQRPVRGVGVAVSDFTMGLEQLGMDFEDAKSKKEEDLENAVDKIRQKYGNSSLKRASIMRDKKLSSADIKGEHVISKQNINEK